MTKLELLDKRKQLRAANKALFDAAKKENRQLSADEQQTVQNNLGELDDVNNELDELEIRGAGNPKGKGSAPQEVRINIGKILASTFQTGTSLSEEEQEFVKEGRNRFAAAGVEAKGNIQIPISYRALVDSSAATGTESQYIFDIATPLREKSALTRLGATFIFDSGLIGIPAYKGTAFDWLAENAEAGDVGQGFDNLVLANKRIAGVIPISKQVLISSNHDVQGIIEGDIINGIDEAINKAVFTFGAATTIKPAGIQSKAAVFASADATLSNANILALETALLEKNVTNIKYAISPAMRAKLMQTVKGGAKSDLGFLLDANGASINGFKCELTNSANDATKALIFAGDFSKVYVKISALDILVDPYTLAGKNAIRLVVNVLSDIQYRQSDAFGWGSALK